MKLALMVLKRYVLHSSPSVFFFDFVKVQTFFLILHIFFQLVSGGCPAVHFDLSVTLITRCQNTLRWISAFKCSVL